jgi:hypothetical protein
MNILRNSLLGFKTNQFNLLKRQFSFSLNNYMTPNYFNIIPTINAVPATTIPINTEMNTIDEQQPQILLMNKRNKMAKRKRAKRKYGKSISLRYR